MKTVLLIDFDSKIPNLALMKISAYHRKKGNKVFLNKACTPDRVYVSCIFKKNRTQVIGLRKMFDCPVEIAGYGVNWRKLPKQIEHLMPDYQLYGCDVSMGFTSRGCIRNCPFCLVPKVEGYIRDHAPISEFLHPDHKKVILLDNNFLASPNWRKNIEFIIDNNLKVNFNQGLDIRLLTRKNAELLVRCKVRDQKFTKRSLYFAWDLMDYEDEVEKGIQILLDENYPKSSIMFYVLVGFNTTLEQDLYRIEKLKSYGVKVFVMPFDGKKHPMTRWVNRRYYEFIPFEEFSARQNRKISTLKKGEKSQHPSLMEWVSTAGG